MNQSSSKQIAEAQTANLDALVGLASNAFEGFEKLLELNIRTMKTALVETYEGAQKALSVKDTQELIALGIEGLRPAMEKALSYHRHLYRIAFDTKSALERVAGAQYEENKREFTRFAESAIGAAPGGSESAVAALQAAITATDSLIENMRSAAEQTMQSAESNFEAAGDAVSSAIQHSVEQVPQKAKK